MKEAEIRKELASLHQVLQGAPLSANPDPAHGQVHVDSSPESLTTAEQLDQLRLQVTYLAFDLEATKRENRYLRQMLQSRPKPPLDDSSDNTGSM